MEIATTPIPGPLAGTPASRRSMVVATAKLLAGFAALIAVVMVLGWAFREELERFGTWFTGRFGLVGMATGSFLADSVHFPVPPQFYILTGVAAGHTPGPAVASVLLGSLLGGLAAFVGARRLARVRFLEKRVVTTRALVERLVARHGLWGLAIASCLPISYCVLCALSGILRLPYRAYAVLAVMRIPRIVLSYLLIVAAWGTTG